MEKIIKGITILIDTVDEVLFESHKWSLIEARQRTDKYYVIMHNGHKTCYLHRMILGVTDKRVIVDHKNRDTNDYRRSNLRIATGTLNRINSTVRKNKKMASLKGVYFKKGASKPYYSMIQSKGKPAIYLGYFYTQEEAAKVYNDKILEIYGVDNNNP